MNLKSVARAFPHIGGLTGMQTDVPRAVPLRRINVDLIRPVIMNNQTPPSLVTPATV